MPERKTWVALRTLLIFVTQVYREIYPWSLKRMRHLYIMHASMHAECMRRVGQLSTREEFTEVVVVKAGVHVKAVLTSLNTAFLPISRCTFQAILNLSAYFVDHSLVVLCKFLGDFWAFWKIDIFSQRIS